MTRKDKIQYLIIEYLMKYGELDIRLPDGILLEIGMLQEGKRGTYIKKDYCSVTTTQKDQSVFLNSYNLGLKFIGNKCIILDENKNEDGDISKMVNVV